MDAELFAKRLRVARKMRGIRQKELATAADINECKNKITVYDLIVDYENIENAMKSKAVTVAAEQARKIEELVLTGGLPKEVYDIWLEALQDMYGDTPLEGWAEK